MQHLSVYVYSHRTWVKKPRAEGERARTHGWACAEHRLVTHLGVFPLSLVLSNAGGHHWNRLRTHTHTYRQSTSRITNRDTSALEMCVPRLGLRANKINYPRQRKTSIIDIPLVSLLLLKASNQEGLAHGMGHPPFVWTHLTCNAFERRPEKSLSYMRQQLCSPVHKMQPQHWGRHRKSFYS